jgi:hypothetical protein
MENEEKHKLMVICDHSPTIPRIVYSLSCEARVTVTTDPFNPRYLMCGWVPRCIVSLCRRSILWQLLGAVWLVRQGRRDVVVAREGWLLDQA